MSISDLIVVMKDGVVQQIGKPQEVYDDPVNLFVAKFLGTPPVNIFAAEVRAGNLYIGEEAVLAVKGAPDGPVTAAVRPEGFIPCADGALTCALSRIEVMGRDVSVICTHSACENEAIRAILRSETKIVAGSDCVQFSLLPSKVYIFDKETGERIPFDAE